MRFSILTPSRGKEIPKKGGNDYVFRFGMVLVVCDCGGTYHRYPVQGKVYEMVEQTGTGKERRATWEMGG